MSNTPTTQTSDGPSEPLPEMIGGLGCMCPPDILHLEGDSIERIAKLGSKASGVEVVFIEYPSDENPGLPNRVPIAIVHGEAPKVIGVKEHIEAWRSAPDRRRGTARVGSLASFIDLLNRHKTGHSVVFSDSDWQKPSFTAVVDYHDKDSDGFADNGTHRVRYDFPLSEEWKIWVKSNGEPMSQADFAAFLEDRVVDLTAPDDAIRNWVERDLATTVATPNQLMTLSRGLEVNVDAKVKNSQTLQSGEGQLVFEEKHNGADGLPIKVPGAFVLNIAPFFRGDRVMVPVRLRYRVKSGTIVWQYQMYRPDLTIAEAVDHATADVRNGTGLPVFEGAPEMNSAGQTV